MTKTNVLCLHILNLSSLMLKGYWNCHYWFQNFFLSRSIGDGDNKGANGSRQKISRGRRKEVNNFASIVLPRFSIDHRILGLAVESNQVQEWKQEELLATQSPQRRSENRKIFSPQDPLFLFPFLPLFGGPTEKK